MCHLVSWKNTPRTNAGVTVLQSEIFVDSDENSGFEFAMEAAETLAKEGAREVRVWKLVGEASLVSSIQWERAKDE